VTIRSHRSGSLTTRRILGTFFPSRSEAVT
jgi:hypothetical protein